MTTIAYDGRTMAGDKAAWSGSLCYPVRKVYKTRTKKQGQILVGFAGSGGFAHAVLVWLKGGAHPGKYPEDGKDVTIALIVRANGTIWKLDNNLRYTRVYGRRHALGAGQDMATGAMAAGATAAQAVRIVMRNSDSAAIGMHTVRFK